MRAFATPLVDFDCLSTVLPHLQDFKNVKKLAIYEWRPSQVYGDGVLEKYFGHFGASVRSLKIAESAIKSDFFPANFPT
jgi:hypothetical protein